MCSQVGGLGRGVQAREVLAGESGRPPGGTAKPQPVEEVGRAAGTMDPVTGGATTTAATPGAIT